jgi:alkane 1-monooxygenase
MLGFFAPHAVAAATVVAYLLERPWAFSTPAWAYFIAIAVDQLAPTRAAPPAPPPDHALRVWRAVIYSWIPLHVAVLLCGLHAVRSAPAGADDAWLAFMTAALGAGTIGGMFGGVIAHEWMHAPRGVHRVVGVGLMSLISYGHFSIGHVAGHHRWVGTRGDPATARLGESLYAFYLRALAGGAAMAWRAEAVRLRRRGRPLWRHDNRVLQICCWQALIYVVVAAAAGPRGVLFFAAQSLVGASLLEVMNYVMHYGLLRGRAESGRLRAVSPQCSWKTSRVATHYLLCGVGLHSYHHCRPSKSFLALRRPAAAPQLPAGLFAMFVLALFPPLWRSVMDPLAAIWAGRR